MLKNGIDKFLMPCSKWFFVLLENTYQILNSSIASLLEFLHPFIIGRSSLFSASMNSIITDSGHKEILRTHHSSSDCVIESALQAIMTNSNCVFPAKEPRESRPGSFQLPPTP